MLLVRGYRLPDAVIRPNLLINGLFLPKQISVCSIIFFGSLLVAFDYPGSQDKI